MSTYRHIKVLRYLLAILFLSISAPSLVGKLSPRAFLQAETTQPNVERMLQAISNSRINQYALPYLPRYYDSSLTPETMEALRRSASKLKPYLIAGLIQQNDRSEETRKYLARQFKRNYVEVRDLIAVYFRWYGLTKDLAMLEEAYAWEKDGYVRASLRAAIEAIQLRGNLIHVKDPPAWPVNKPYEPIWKFDKITDVLRKEVKRDCKIKN